MEALSYTLTDSSVIEPAIIKCTFYDLVEVIIW